MNKKWWEYLDYASIEPKMYVYGRDRFITKIGAFLSILAAVSMLVLSGYFFINFLERTDLNVIYYSNTKSFTPYVNLNGKPFFWRFEDVNNNEIDPRIGRVVSTYWVESNGTQTIYELETEPCTFEKHLTNPIYKEYFKFNISMYQCIKPNTYNLSLSADDSTNSVTYFNIYISECENSTQNGNYCLPVSEIETQLANLDMYFEFYFPTYIIDHYNRTNPIKEYYYTNMEKIFSNFFYSYYEGQKILNYSSDDGNVFQDFIDYEGFSRDNINSFSQLSPQKTQVYIPKSIAVVQFTINSSQFDQYKRTYPKLQSVVANIGGIFKFITVIAQIISQFVTEKMMFVNLANWVIFFDKKNKGSVGREGRSNMHPSSNINLGKSSINIMEGVNQGTKQITQNNLLTPNPIAIHKTTRSVISKFYVPTTKPINMTISYSKNNKGNFVESEFKEIGLLESILPRRCVNKNSAAQIAEICKKIIKKQLSCEDMLQNMSDINKLKLLLFDKKQLVVFNSLKNPNLDQHVRKLYDKKGNLEIKQIEELLVELSQKEDGLSKSLFRHFEQ